MAYEASVNLDEKAKELAELLNGFPTNTALAVLEFAKKWIENKSVVSFGNN